MKIVRMSQLAALAVLLILTCLGCATSSVIKSTQDLSTSGIAYADTMDQLIEVTIDTVIDSDSNDLLKMQANFKLDDAEQQEKQLRSFLTSANTQVESLVGTLSEFRVHTKLLKSYFTNLQTLAQTDVAAGATSAVQGLSGSINSMNQAIKDKTQLVINDTEQNLIGQLAGMVAQRAQAASLEKALKRDAPVIGEQLMLQEKLLVQLKQILTSRYKNEMEAFKTQQVLLPFVKNDIKSSDTWKQNRKRVIQASFFDQRLESAVLAAKQLQSIWQDVLRGGQDLGAIQATLEEINEFTGLIKQLKEAEKQDQDP